MRLAIFDLDGTLLPFDVGHQWVHFLARVADQDLTAAIAEQNRFAQDYREGRFDVGAFVEFQMGLLSRFPRFDLDRWMGRFMQEEVVTQIPASAKALVSSVRQEGYTIVMATGTQSFVSAPVADYFDIKHLLATRPEVDQRGQMTGNHVGGYCFGKHKVDRVKEFLASRGQRAEQLESIIAFSDSMNDLPLLEFVHSVHGRAIATNPDPQLKEYANKRGWSVIQIFEGDH